jgi:GNAT superfamily N-acetyltransferase
MIHTIRVNSDNSDFRQLVNELDKLLSIINGDEDSFFSQYNKLDNISNVIIAYEDSIPIGCGAIKEYNAYTMEIKRMFVVETHRNKGIASLILKELEHWSKEMNYSKCILETSIHLLNAISLYKKNNYYIIPNYGQYKDIKSSVCFEKEL